MAATQVVPAVRPKFVPSPAGTLWRTFVAVLLIAVAAALPWIASTTWDRRIALAAIYAVIGLSVNVITGHAGQVSLGHQAFVGIGAFSSAYVVSQLEGDFITAIIVASGTGAALAAVLGLVALRISGLYLALVTLAFGLTAQTTLFNWRAFTGGGAGAEAPRPVFASSEMAYAYLCLGVLALVLLFDWRFVKSKAGRAITAVRNNEQVAATLGVNVTAYKLLAFVASGFLAGLAGSLFAHLNTEVAAPDFEFEVALVWVLMAVVGGLGSRAGVVVASMFFALLPSVLPHWLEKIPSRPDFLNDAVLHVVTPLIGALLLLLTLTLYPGGIAQQMEPIRRWLAGGPFHEHRRPAGNAPEGGAAASRDAGEPAAEASSAAHAAEPAGTGEREER